MIIHTNKGQLKVGKVVGDMETLPQLCFECELLSEALKNDASIIVKREKQAAFEKVKDSYIDKKYKSVDELEKAFPIIDEYKYLILYFSKNSDKVTGLYEEGGIDATEIIEYAVSMELEVTDSKKELKDLIMSALEAYYF